MYFALLILITRFEVFCLYAQKTVANSLHVCNYLGATGKKVCFSQLESNCLQPVPYKRFLVQFYPFVCSLNIKQKVELDSLEGIIFSAAADCYVLTKHIDFLWTQRYCLFSPPSFMD